MHIETSASDTHHGFSPINTELWLQQPFHLSFSHPNHKGLPPYARARHRGGPWIGPWPFSQRADGQSWRCGYCGSGELFRRPARVTAFVPPLQGLHRCWFVNPGRLHASLDFKLPISDCREGAGLQPFQFEPTHVGCYILVASGVSRIIFLRQAFEKLR